jgi:hypothetical protein
MPRCLPQKSSKFHELCTELNVDADSPSHSRAIGDVARALRQVWHPAIAADAVAGVRRAASGNDATARSEPATGSASGRGHCRRRRRQDAAALLAIAAA